MPIRSRIPTTPRSVPTPRSVRAPGARLHVQVHGSGSPVLVLQSGEGDADRSVDLAMALSARHTVITLDRRGLSRSPRDDADAPVGTDEHVADVQAVLAAVTDEPVIVVGCSLGALIGLHLVCDSPERVALLVAHEPVAPRLLPEPSRTRHREELTEVRNRYLRSGLSPALTEMARVLGIRLEGQESESDLTPQPMNARRVANFDHFLRHDLPAINSDTLDVAALAAVDLPIVPAIGRTTPSHVFDVQCARALAAVIGREPVMLPGGHNGNLSHPRAWAAAITDLAREHAAPKAS